MASKPILYNRIVRLRDDALKGFRYCLDVAGCQETILGICPNHSRIHSSSPPDCTGAWGNEVSILVILVAKTFHFPLFDRNYLLLASRGALLFQPCGIWWARPHASCLFPTHLPSSYNSSPNLLALYSESRPSSWSFELPWSTYFSEGRG